jgi:hypothetical protein
MDSWNQFRGMSAAGEVTQAETVIHITTHEWVNLLTPMSRSQREIMEKNR